MIPFSALPIWAVVKGPGAHMQDVTPRVTSCTSQARSSCMVWKLLPHL